jgi:hypothetical protein
MERLFYRLFIIASALMISSIAVAETVSVPKVLTGMTILPDSLELAVNESFSWDADALTDPSRLEIHIYNAVNGLGAASIEINKIGIAKVLFVNTDKFLRVVLFPVEGAHLPSQVDVTDTPPGLLIHGAEPTKQAHSAPVAEEPAIPVETSPPPGTVSSSTPTAKSALAPVSVHTEMLPGIVTPVVTPMEKSNHYYSLIAGESVNRKRLNPVVEKLTAAGFKPEVASATREVEVFRLKVACFAGMKPAELRRAQIARHTRKAFIAKDVDSYCVFAGSLMSEDSARREQKRLEPKGLKGLQIVRARVPLKVWQVTCGRNANGLESALLIRELSKRGIAVWIAETGNWVPPEAQFKKLLSNPFPHSRN